MFGLAATRVRRIPRGYVNAVWLVDSDKGRHVLKRATAERAPADLLYEHQLLRHLDLAGWLVPTPVPTRAGPTVLEVDGTRWWLARWLPGRAPAHDTAAYGRWAGHLLAELHDATAPFGRLYPPPDDLRLRAVADWPFHPTRGTLRSGAQRLADAYPHLAAAVGDAIERLNEELPRRLSLPSTVTHFDFHHDNLRVHRGTTAVLDFDFSHPDECVADIATALHFTATPRVAEALVAGYDAKRRLSDDEVAAIPAMFDARKLLHVAWLSTHPDLSEAATPIRQTLDALGSCPLQ